MKTRLYFSVSCLLMAILFSLTAKAQDDYFSGKLLFKVWDTSTVTLPDYDTSYPETYPYLQSLIDTYQVTEIFRPFENDVNTKLKQVYEIVFSDTNRQEELMENLPNYYFIEYAEVIPKILFFTLPNDNLFREQWYLESFNADSIWNITIGDTNVAIAVIDNAFLTSHEDIDDKIVHPFDVYHWDNNPNPPTGFTNVRWAHGTHVAGIAGAETNNQTGVSSLGWSLKIMPIKVQYDNASDPMSGGSVITAIHAFRHAIDNDAGVISMSWGFKGNNNTFYTILKEAIDSNIICVAAAGNISGSVKLFDTIYPAAYSEVIGVGATDQYNNVTLFSNIGISVDILAPGSNILSASAETTTTYKSKGGTSQATPIVAAICGLIKSYKPLLSVDSIKSCLYSSAINLDRQNYMQSGNIGYGLVNPLGAINCIPKEYTTDFFISDSTQCGCIGQPVQFSAISQSGVEYVWSFDNGNEFVSQSDTYSHTFYSQDIYDVKLVIKDEFLSNRYDSMTKFNYLIIKDCSTQIKSTKGHWIFGKNAHIDFASGKPKRIYDTSIINEYPINTLRPTACQSDSNGNLLFYAVQPQYSEIYVRNDSNKAIANGNPIDHTNTNADIGVIVPDLANSKQYYLFQTNEPRYNGNHFRYSIIKIDSTGDSVVTVSKGIHGPPGAYYEYIQDTNGINVDSAIQVGPGVIAIPAEPTCDPFYWIITHANPETPEDPTVAPPHQNMFYVYRMDENGVHYDHMDSSYAILDEWVFRASPDGTKIAFIDSFMFQFDTSFHDNTHPNVYDFDRKTGKISNCIRLKYGKHGFCFSPNSKVFYTYDTDEYDRDYIYQYDLTLDDPNSSIKKILFDNTYVWSMQLGPDSVLYLNSKNGNKLKAIYFPDSLITDDEPNNCGLIFNGMSLVDTIIRTTHSGRFFPNFVDALPILNEDVEVDYSYSFSNCNTISFCAPVYDSVKYKWYVDGVLRDSSRLFTINCCDFPVSYVVTLEVPGKGVMIKTIEADTLPLVDIQADLHDCSQNRYDKFTALIDVDLSKLSFNWSVGDDGTITDNRDTIIFVEWDSNTHTVSLTVTDLETGCTQETSKGFIYNTSCENGCTFDSSNSQNPFPAFVVPPYSEPVYILGGLIKLEDSADLTLDHHILLKECTEILVDSTSRLNISNNNRLFACSPWAGITLQGTPASNQLNIENSTIYNARAAIYANGSSYITIDSSTFTNNKRDMVLFGSGTGSLHITHTDFNRNTLGTVNCKSNYRKKIPGGTAMIYLENYDDFKFNNCNFTNTVESGSGFHGIYLDKNSTFEIENDTFNGEYDKLMAIYSNQAGTPSSISDNVFDIESSIAVLLDDCSEIDISDNQAHCSSDTMMKISLSNSIQSIGNDLKYIGDEDTNTTGIYVWGSSIDVTSTTMEKFTNGIEYYDTSSQSSLVEMSQFDSNKFGLVIASEVHPYYDSNTVQADLINLLISCSKFRKNEIGIFGSGELLEQGDQYEDAANEFDSNSQWHMLWQNNNTIDYYYHQQYDTFTNPSFITGSSYIMNGTIQNTSDINPIGINPVSTCFNTWIFIDYGALNNLGSNDVIGTGTDIKIYPNPFTDKMVFEINSKILNEVKIGVYDVFGKEITTKSVKGRYLTLSTENWPEGIYFIRLTNKKQEKIDIYKMLKTK